VTEQGTTVRVYVSGEIDAANAADLYRALEESVTHATELLEIDLSDVTYLDSAGIHVLFRVGRALEERSGRLSLIVPPGSVVEETLRYADALGLFATTVTPQDKAAGA
jgi:anti-anti-sigma factor